MNQQLVNQHLVFIFGTLKRGFPNHGFNHGTLLLGRSCTAEKYPLYLVGDRHSPWMVNDPGAGYQVHGEVFSVDQDALDEMDQLERVNQPDGYQRVVIKVLDQTGQLRDAETYMKPLSLLKNQEITDGPLSNYTLDNASSYSPRSKAVSEVA